MKMAIAFLSMFLALLWAAFVSGPLTWDGSYYLFNILDKQTFFCPHGRLSNIIFQTPVLIAHRYCTDDTTLLRFLFSAPYTMIPFLSLLLSWAAVRHKIHLFIWPAMGICLAMLPSIFNFTGEMNIALLLIWPFTMILLARPPSMLLWGLVPLLSLAMFYLHPVAMPMFALLSLICSVAGALHNTERSRYWLMAAGFAALSFLKLLFILFKSSAYESKILTASGIADRFGMSPNAILIVFISLLCAFLFFVLSHTGRKNGAYIFRGLLLVLFLYDIIIMTGVMRQSPFGNTITLLAVSGMLALTAASIILFIRAARMLDRVRCIPDIQDLLQKVLAGIAVITGLLMLYYVAEPYRWHSGIGNANWGLLASIPLLYMAAVEGLGRNADEYETHVRMKFAGTMIWIFSAVIFVQSMVWSGLIRELHNELSAKKGSCVTTDSMAWLHGTPIDFWSTPSLAIVIQGKYPDTLVLAGNDCETALNSDQIPLTPWRSRSKTKGWFDLSSFKK
jgi:hypothetical protein